ncbi:MAG: hypothetical protein DWQ01_10185 [Planctomycetota bacterium]|nr:MAG: hypothetical protein DWQ01_10185 [Planctomycetota bacterium]
MAEPVNELFRRAAAGDREASNELFSSQERWLRNHIRRRLSPRVRRHLDSGDVVQEIMVDIWRKLLEKSDHSFESEGQLRGYLTGVANNRVQNMIRDLQSKKRDIRRQIEDIDPSTSFGEDRQANYQDSPSQDAATREMQGMVKDEVESLNPDERELIDQRFNAELSMTQIGKKQGISDRGAMKRLKKIFTRLSLRLARLDSPPDKLGE